MIHIVRLKWIASLVQHTPHEASNDYMQKILVELSQIWICTSKSLDWTINGIFYIWKSVFTSSIVCPMQFFNSFEAKNSIPWQRSKNCEKQQTLGFRLHMENKRSFQIWVCFAHCHFCRPAPRTEVDKFEYDEHSLQCGRNVNRKWTHRCSIDQRYWRWPSVSSSEQPCVSCSFWSSQGEHRASAQRLAVCIH